MSNIVTQMVPIANMQMYSQSSSRKLQVNLLWELKVLIVVSCKAFVVALSGAVKLASIS